MIILRSIFDDIKLNKLISDVKLYAHLIRSIGVQGSGSNIIRPLQPVECAQCIKRLIDEEGDTLHQVAERLNLGKPQDQSKLYKKRDTTQVTSFLNLLKVSEKSRQLAGWGYEGYPSIPFSTMSQLATMTPSEQDMIIQSILTAKDKKKTLGKEDVKTIKKWRNANPNLPIEEYIEKILKLKPTTIITHLIVAEIRKKLQEFIGANKDYREKLLDILRKNLEGEFYSIDSTKILITISMDEDAYKTFHEKQYKQNTPFTQFLNDFLEDRIG